MRIPEQFEIGGQTIKIIVKDEVDKSSRYGYYNDVREEIYIFKKVEINNEIVELTESQIENTMFHELFHVFQFHSKDKISETESSTYATFMTQFIKSSGLKII